MGTPSTRTASNKELQRRPRRAVLMVSRYVRGPLNAGVRCLSSKSMNSDAGTKRERTPQNADGDFYVEEGTCLRVTANHQSTLTCTPIDDRFLVCALSSHSGM